MEEFLSSFPRMEPASINYSTDVYEHSKNETSDDFDNEQSWFNFAFNVATGMFKNEISSNNNNNNNNNNENQTSNVGSNRKSRRSHSSRRHQISIWGPSSFRQISGLNDIPEESEGHSNKNNNISKTNTNENSKKNNTENESKNENKNENKSENNKTSPANSIISNHGNLDDNSSMTSLEIPFMEDILSQQPSLATSQIVHGSNSRLNKLQYSQSYPSLASLAASASQVIQQPGEMETQSQSESQGPTYTNTTVMTDRQQDTLNSSVASQSMIAIGHLQDFIAPSPPKHGSFENEIDWSMKQANHSNMSQLLNDNNSNHHHKHSHNHNNNGNTVSNDEYFGGMSTNRISNDKMNSAEHYNLYSKFKKSKLHKQSFDKHNNNNNNNNNNSETTTYTDDTASIQSIHSTGSSHVSSQYNMVNVDLSKSKMVPQTSGSQQSSIHSSHSSHKMSFENDLNYDFEMKGGGNDMETRSEKLKLIGSSIAQFSTKFSKKRKHKKKEKSPRTTVSDTESNMSSNVSWCVLSDK